MGLLASPEMLKSLPIERLPTSKTSYTSSRIEWMASFLCLPCWPSQPSRICPDAKLRFSLQWPWPRIEGKHRVWWCILYISLRAESFFISTAWKKLFLFNNNARQKIIVQHRCLQKQSSTGVPRQFAVGSNKNVARAIGSQTRYEYMPKIIF